MNPVPDAHELQRRAANPAASVWVAASAGSGKTKVLTDRVLTLMLDGTLPQRILCLTFTKAAAAEMANRITRRLGEWAIAEEERLTAELALLTGTAPTPDSRERARRLFAQVLETPGGLKIQTIHSFCESLLGRFPLEAGIAPHFEVMDERSAAKLIEAARDTVLAAARDGALADALAAVTAHVQEDQFAALMAALAGERGRLRRAIAALGGIDGAAHAAAARLGVAATDTAATVIAAACVDGIFDRDGLSAVARALLDGDGGTDGPRGQAMADWLAADGDGRQRAFDAYIAVFMTKALARRAKLLPKKLAEKDPALAAAMAAEADRLEEVVRRRKAAVTACATVGLLRLADSLLDAYGLTKAACGRLDYDDLIYGSQELLRHPGVAPWVLFKLDGGLDHILIDEAQDTNPDQWDIVAALAEEFFSGEGARSVRRTVFAVGDLKQSIFSFQRADPEAFRRLRRHFNERVAAAAAEWREIELDISFRSTAAVLRAVDAVFAASPACDGVVEDGSVLRHRAFRDGHAGLVEVWPVVGPRDAPEDTAWTPPVEQLPSDNPVTRLATLIATRIKGWIGRERLESRDRSLRAGDVMVLVRSRGQIMEAVVRALKAAGVPVAGVDRMVLMEQLAVMDLVALGRFLLLPEDDLTLATVLKGPLIGFDDDDLFRLAHGRRAETLWRRLERMAAAEPRFAAAHDWLAGLLARTDYSPPFELFADVLSNATPRGETGRQRMVARLGAEAEDPIDEFLGLALNYERSEPPSLQGFLHWLEAGAVEIKRDLEQSGRDEVRVMTVHGAKGLQAPVVILPDTTAKPAASPAILWCEDLPIWPPKRSFEEEICAQARAEAERRRDEEYRRLLYVAMTRAEDRLYVCGWHGARKPADGCWYDMIRCGLEGIAEPVAFDFTAESVEGWAGAGLRLATPQRAAPQPDMDGEGPPLADAPPARWMLAPPPPEPTPSRPLAPSRPTGAEPAVRSPLGPGNGKNFQRGLLIHRLLQSLPDLPPRQRRAAAERFLARPVVDLAAAEQAAIVDEVLAVLEAPDLAPLFGPDGRAEVSVAGTVAGPDGPVTIAGKVDRLVVTPEEVLVLDYKSMRPAPFRPDEVPEFYLRQMAAYRAVLAGLWRDRPVRCILVWTEGPRLMPLDSTRLDQYARPP